MLLMTMMMMMMMMMGANDDNILGIFRVLAEHQLQNPTEPYLSYKDYFEKCREQFLVNNEITMRTQLTEFRDHKVIITKKPRSGSGGDGGIYFTIPVGVSLLAQILEEMEE